MRISLFIYTLHKCIKYKVSSLSGLSTCSSLLSGTALLTLTSCRPVYSILFDGLARCDVNIRLLASIYRQFRSKLVNISILLTPVYSLCRDFVQSELIVFSFISINLAIQLFNECPTFLFGCKNALICLI